MADARGECIVRRSEKWPQLTSSLSHVIIMHAQTCTLLTANAPPTVGRLYHFTTRSDPDNASTRRALPQALHTAALMRESALKSTIFVGVPRVSAWKMAPQS